MPPESPVRPILVRAPVPPMRQGRIDSIERNRTGSQWGDMRGPQMSAVLAQADAGDISAWDSLSRHAISSNADLSSLNTTRRDRVIQADYVIRAAKYGDQKLARLAAEFIEERLTRIEDWQQSQRDILHAIGPGDAFGEMIWKRNAVSKVVYVDKISNELGSRFRFDEQWQPRLWDGGRKRSLGSLYGEALDPRTWIYHRHQEVSGNPCARGVFRAVCWDWLFSQWIERFWINEREKYGHPILMAKLEPDTKESVRNQILDDLQYISTEHVGVFEGHEIQLLESSVRSSTDYQAYLAFRQAKFAKAWLGVSDSADPGANGSRAAVDSRIGASMDPRMITDGESFWNTIRKTLFKQLIALNGYQFGVYDTSVIPIPECSFKTADDEVKVDAGDKQAEVDDGRVDSTKAAPVVVDMKAASKDAPKDAPVPEVANVQATALNGAQVTSLIDLVTKVAAGTLPRASGVEIAQMAFQLDAATAERVIGEAGRGFKIAPEPSAPTAAPVQASALAAEPQPDPKATAPVAPGLTKAATPPTSISYPNPFARTRSNVSGV